MVITIIGDNTMPKGVYERKPRTPAQITADEARSKALTGRTRSPETCAKMSEGQKNSEATKAKTDAQRGVSLSPEHCDAISKGLQESEKVKAKAEAQKGVPLTPEHCAAVSKAKKGVPQSPEHAAAALKGREEAGIYDAQRGGDDIVNHHYLYDHSDLSLNTIQMTRSDHMRLHRLLQKLKYIVPHINIKEI